MNKERVRDAIEVMKSATNLNMTSFQSSDSDRKVSLSYSIEELHACGNTACFAGYIAMSDMFKKAGGRVDRGGCPMLEDEFDGGYAIAKYFDFDGQLGLKLVYGDVDALNFSRFYKKEWSKITASDVITKLELILKGKLK